MTSITKSAAFEAEVKVKRLFNTLKEDTQQLQKQTEELLTTANAMRRTLANAMLGIAQIEALYVDQTEEKRKVDSELHAATIQIKQLILEVRDRTVAAMNAVTDRSAKIDGMKQQADRIATDPFIRPGKDELLEGVEYVDIGYIADQLGVATKSVRRYLEEGLIDPPDTVKSTGGRPKQLWAKPTADMAIIEFRRHGYDKRSGAAVACLR